MSSRVSIAFVVGMLVLWLGAAAPLVSHFLVPEKKLPDLGSAPAFTLFDTNGQHFASDQLSGHVWIANFFFASCPGVCPAVHSSLQKLLRYLPSRSGVQIVSITVDPEHDTPEALRVFAEKLAVPANRWTFLTGDLESIKKIQTEGFKLGDGGEPALHTTRLALIDREGRIRGYYHGTEPEDVARLESDVRELLH